MYLLVKNVFQGAAYWNSRRGLLGAVLVMKKCWVIKINLQYAVLRYSFFGTRPSLKNKCIVWDEAR
ncbi:hypothetical protein BZL35_00494 [Candidatus Pandoraea novymonadis]|uniref:Uncharacterized protein n=1 Tax=Candidatus Pandoraea novymonadis TaxID=1808959 RepID=A0ABX5FEY6_9BURK|nr:hypothetical protein BZL35_00494 [Candidatus Pandoraea novymonadis]